MSARKKLSALRRKAKASIQKTQETKVEVSRKRSARPKVKAPSRDVAPQINSKTVERWFQEEIRELYGPRLLVSAWAVKERTLAKKMLKEYGEDLAEKGVRHFCQVWPDMVGKSKGRLRGQPTMAFLWAARHTIFSEVQLLELGQNAGASPSGSDEFKSNDDPVEGW